MYERLRHIAILLLCVSINATLLSPALHQLEHAREHEHLQLSIALQTGHVHSDVEAWSEALDDLAHNLPACVVCSIVLQTIPPTPQIVPTTQNSRLTTVELAESVVAFSPSRFSIRAPPSVG